MRLEHLIEHLTAPSTVRGICWTLGSIVALWLLAKGDTQGAVEVLGQAALAVGAVGVLTRDQKPCDCDDHDAE